jgi:hypothetical protein
MYNVNDIYKIITFILRKQRGVFLTIDEVFLMVDKAQLEVFEYYFKDYGITQVIHDALQQFKVTNYQFTSNNGGSVSYAADYLHLLGGVFTVTGSTVNKVRFIQTDELPDALTAQLRKVNTANPIAIDTSVGFQLYPQSAQIGFYSYLKRPVKPVYGYTKVGRTITYDANTSTQLDWSDAYISKIIAKALAYYGINMDEDKLIQFSMMEDKENG